MKTRMEWIKRILYGALIGIAAIAPGLSGGTIAIALGFYENLIRAISELLHHFKKNFLYLLPFGAGALISAAALSVVIHFIFIHYPLPANALFTGFILGTIPFIRKRLWNSLNEKKPQPSHLCTTAVFFFLILLPVFLQPDTAPEKDSFIFAPDPLSILLLFGMGMIIAATMVIPGLSGTMILSAMGCYLPLLSIASTFVTAVISFDFSYAVKQLVFIVPLGLGFLAGMFLTARLVAFLFEKVPAYVYSSILGLIASAPLVMMTGIPKSGISPLTVMVSVFAFGAGILLVQKLGDHDI